MPNARPDKEDNSSLPFTRSFLSGLKFGISNDGPPRVMFEIGMTLELIVFIAVLFSPFSLSSEPTYRRSAGPDFVMWAIVFFVVCGYFISRVVIAAWASVNAQIRLPGTQYLWAALVIMFGLWSVFVYVHFRDSKPQQDDS